MIYIDNIYEPDEISCQHYEANKFTLQACNWDEIEGLFPHFEFRDTEYIVYDQFWNPRGYAFCFTEKLEGILAKLWQSSIGLTLSYLATFPSWKHASLQTWMASHSVTLTDNNFIKVFQKRKIS